MKWGYMGRPKLKLEEMSLKRLKKEADTVFSKFIRLRDSGLTINGEYRIGVCITCGRRKPWQQMDNGHYIKRQYLPTRFDEKNCNLQCKHCNAFEQGANEKYKVAIDKKWGPGTAEMLEIKKHNKSKLDKFEYIVLIKHYRQKVKQFENN